MGENGLSAAAKVNGRQGGWGVTRVQQLPPVPASQAQKSLKNDIHDRNLGTLEPSNKTRGVSILPSVNWFATGFSTALFIY